MEVEGIDLVALLEGGPAPQVDNFDDLFGDADLLQYLTAPEVSEPSPQQLQTVPAPSVSAPAVPSTSSNSSQSEAAAASPALPPIPVLPAAPLAAMQLQPAAAACGLDRLVTTTAAQQVWAAMLQAAYAQAPPAACADEAKARAMPAGASRQGSRDSEADSSDTDEELQDSKAKCGNKRKAPEVDWRQIEDPAERRRQRRLAKNRVTAARSRERKKAMWSELEEKLKNMENENAQLRAMLEQFARENSSLKNQLLTITRASAAGGGAGAGGAHGLCPQARAGKTMDPAAILPVFIVTLLVVCSVLPGDKACALLGSVLPLALVASVLGAAEAGAASGTSFGESDFDSAAADGSGFDPSSSSSTAATAAAAGKGNGAAAGRSGSLSGGLAAFEVLFRLLHMIGTLLAGSGRALQRSVKRLLFARHRYLGRAGLRRLGASLDGKALLAVMAGAAAARGRGIAPSAAAAAGAEGRGEAAGCELPGIVPCWKGEAPPAGAGAGVAVKLEPVC